VLPVARLGRETKRSPVQRLDQVVGVASPLLSAEWTINLRFRGMELSARDSNIWFQIAQPTLRFRLARHFSRNLQEPRQSDVI
jgi:hypothetical protein